MRDMSDARVQYHLSVIENPALTRQVIEWEAEKNGGPTWMTAIRLGRTQLSWAR